jgi:hypothetical protein
MKVYLLPGSTALAAEGVEVVVFTKAQVAAAKLIQGLPEEDRDALFSLTKPKAKKSKPKGTEEPSEEAE